MSTSTLEVWEGGESTVFEPYCVKRRVLNFFVCRKRKTPSFRDARCYSLWGDSNIGWVLNEGTNGAGSIVTMWHKEAFSYGTHIVGTGFIAIVGYHLKTKRQCVVVNVYVQWEVLTALKQSYCNLALVVCGDFIVVRREEERKGIGGCSSQKKEIDGFNRFIENNGLLDIPCVGKKYTWYKANGTAKSILDRFLMSKAWL